MRIDVLKRVYDAIHHHNATYHESPSIIEVADACGYTIPRTSRAFRRLRDLGYIHWREGSHRTVRVIKAWDIEYRNVVNL
jgi:CRP-like cAMP-binding protein